MGVAGDEDVVGSLRYCNSEQSPLVWAEVLCFVNHDVVKAGVAIPTLPTYVIGRVALTGVVAFTPPSMVRVGEYELRAANARIVELHLQAGSGGPRVAARLSRRYDVPVDT